jgi:hypothetical protein
LSNFSWANGWQVKGWDTFAGESYPIGSYSTEAGAVRAAQRHLRSLEKSQPTAQSGGQAPGGIQDRVSIVRPDGSEYPVTAE